MPVPQYTRSLALTVAAVLFLGACASMNRRTTTVEAGGDVATTDVVPANDRSLPAGATIVATLDRALGTKVNKAGDTFTATVATTLYARDGSVVVPAGARIDGHVTAIDDSDNATDAALIRLTFDAINFRARRYPFSASILQSNAVQTGGTSTADRNKQIIIGGVVGAALGALLGDKDLDKIIIGGAIGAAAGSIISLGTEMNATLPAGSQMTLRATQAVDLR